MEDLDDSWSSSAPSTFARVSPEIHNRSANRALTNKNNNNNTLRIIWDALGCFWDGLDLGSEEKQQSNQQRNREGSGRRLLCLINLNRDHVTRSREKIPTWN